MRPGAAVLVPLIKAVRAGTPEMSEITAGFRDPSRTNVTVAVIAMEVVSSVQTAPSTRGSVTEACYVPGGSIASSSLAKASAGGAKDGESVALADVTVELCA
jgi:hypothetical protein